MNIVELHKTQWGEVVVLKRILRCFKLVSVLKINLSKSMIVGVGSPRKIVQSFSNKLHCKIGKMPFLYLGPLIEAKARSKAVWDPVVQNFKRKPSMWKRNYLSLRGRITLIKVALSDLPVYYMSLLRMPVGVRGTEKGSGGTFCGRVGAKKGRFIL